MSSFEPKKGRVTDLVSFSPLKLWLGVALAAVATAAEAFESRWTMRALKRVDEELYNLWCEQEADYGKALVAGSQADVEEQAAAMVRGYVAIANRMAQAQEPDDAYLLGIDSKTGIRIAIAEQRHANARVRELYGESVAVFTPDELASIVAGLQVLAQVKKVWPDAQIIELRPKEAPDAA